MTQDSTSRFPYTTPDGFATNTLQLQKADEDKVGSPSKAYNWMFERTILSRTLMGGTDAMREASTMFLPKFSKETDADYHARLQGAVLTNVFKKTVFNLSNKPLTEMPKMPDDTNPQLLEWIESDIDREGNDLSQFSKELIKDALVSGLTHVLAEFPRINEDEILTLADVRERGLRPYLVHIKAENLIGWRSSIINGVRTLTQIRIKEMTYRDKGKYGQVLVETVRVIEPGRFELWIKDSDSNEWMLEDEGETTLDYIPLSTIYFNRKDFMISEPTLDDLAHLNQHHWQSQASQNHALTIARIPVMFGKMLGNDVDPATGETKEVLVSPNSLVIGNNKDSDLSFVEHSGKALEAGDVDLKNTLQTMEAFSMQLLIPRTGDVTATEKAIDTASANSDLQSMVESLEDAMQNALTDMTRLAGDNTTEVGKPSYFKEFNLKVGNVEEMKLMLESKVAGTLSESRYLIEMDRRGFFAEDFDLDTEQELIANGGIPTNNEPLDLNQDNPDDNMV